MHDHDQDLIAAYAEGALTDDAEARALVESCEACRADYEAQAAVLRMLSSAPRPALTELERARLHRGVRAAVEPKTPAGAGSPWWRRLAFAAAALFLMVGVGTVLANLGAGGDAADTLAEVGDALAGEGGVDAARGGEEAAPLEESAETTVAAAQTAEDAPGDLSFSRLAEDARARLAQGGDTPEADPPGLAECLESLGLAEQLLVEVIEEGTTLWVVAPTEEADAPLTFIDPTGCEIVYVDR